MTPTATFTSLRASPSRRRALLARGPLLVCTAALAMTLTTGASAATVWTGDFETGDISQWNTALNGGNISIVTSPVLQGSRAAQIRLTNDARWSNGMKRVELNHKPASARTDEGAETYFAWSFYLPEALAASPRTQIGYWESDQTYQQVMSFEVEGQRIRFSTRKPQNKVHWEADGMVTPGVWHRIAMRIKWSKTAGSVDVWFDGEQVVTQGAAQTLADDNDHFTQIGLLRDQVEFQDTPILILDDAVEGDTLADVRPALPDEGHGGAGGESGVGGADGTGGDGGTGELGSGGGGAGAGGAPGGAGGQGGVDASTTTSGTGEPSDSVSTSASTGAGSTSVGSTGGGDAEPADEADSGCSCRAGGSTPLQAPAALAGVVATLAAVARRRRRG